MHTCQTISVVNSEPLSWCNTLGGPYRVTHVVIKVSVTATAVLLSKGVTSSHFVKQSCITSRYCLPVLLGGRGPIRSNATRSKGAPLAPVLRGAGPDPALASPNDSSCRPLPTFPGPIYTRATRPMCVLAHTFDRGPCGPVRASVGTHQTSTPGGPQPAGRSCLVGTGSHPGPSTPSTRPPWPGCFAFRRPFPWG